MTPALLDTDILSAIMKAKLPVVAQHAVSYLNQHGRFSFSSITRFEILRGLLATSATVRLRAFESMCQRSEIIELTDPIIVRAAELYADLSRRGQLISDADILIAATALYHGRTLVTANTAHFQRVHGLAIRNWTKP